MQTRRRTAVAALLTCALTGGTAALTTGARAAPAPSATTADAGPTTAGLTAAKTQAPSPRLRLPRPTGPHAVGRASLHLVDHSRRDPWVPKAGARELMVSLYYPARTGTGTPAPYMSRKGARLFLADRGLDDVPAEVLSGTRTHTRTGARPAPGSHPLVVLSPGFSVPGTTLTGLAEELTSRGYVVAVVDHAYEAVGVAFPGRGILPCAACDRVGDDTFEPAAKGRAKDLRFVLDRLTGARPGWRHAGLIDKKRVGMAGHSLGGAGAAAATAGDARVRAAVNMDGPFADVGPASDLSGRPLLMLGTAADHSGRDKLWEATWDRISGWKRWLRVAGADHFAFTDLAPLAGQLGEDTPGGLPGRRAAAITGTYVGAFFDQHLRGRPQPVLNGPSAANPEVRFHHLAPPTSQN
ncbi:alpha/beta hydrolase family protein [Streptomyces flavofungini]|uniref:Alpha/beta hydrolase n=1 Tax=Streptomyces flavofungini TaxID=68200 RepID=A0ABS0X6A5_9ACTN|nr:alpha/beta hydrolase [Streptomyces flavofungini]MBJ3808737.1 alpha/beta hydrolase [Streptomyces flavofungini]GHC49725.1 lipase [Streptomyces flavofungini]